jgi:soluble lytic murein transglycosylase-like protein
MGEPERPQRSFASDPGSPGAPTFERRSTDRRRHDANRRQGEHGPSERRGSDRRKRVARAGLLAAITIAGSFPRLHHPSAQPATPGPQTSDATTQPPERRAADYVLDRIDQIIDEASATYGVNPGFVRAIIHAESRFNPNAVSHVGAQGLMQLMPVTARYLGVSDPFDMRQNIFAGVKYLSNLLDRFDGDVGLAAAAYNAGPNAVARRGGIPPFRETRGYVKKVKGFLESAPDMTRTDTRTAD